MTNTALLERPAGQRQLDFFTKDLPLRPYCSDNLENGLVIRPAIEAVTKKYLQYNPPAKIHWLVFDIDRAFSRFDLDGMVLAHPNILVRNPRNQHAHALYGLVAPVARTEQAHIKPLKYLAAINEGYRHALQADVGFKQLICKNPLSDAWVTEILRDSLYDMQELAEYVDLKAASARIRATPKKYQSGVGRNCSLFDSLRGWAYRWVDDYKSLGRDAWMERVYQQAEKLNTFVDPLPFSEVKSVAKSVGTWVWKRYTGSHGRKLDVIALAEQGLTPETFSLVQSNLGKMGMKKRWGDNEPKAVKAIEMKASGMTQKQIAAALEVSQGTISNWLKKSK